MPWAMPRALVRPLPACCAALMIACSSPPGAVRVPEPAPVSPPGMDVRAAVSTRVDSLADTYVAAYFARFPVDATFEGYPDADHARLDRNSAAAARAWRQRMEELLGAVVAIDPEPLRGTTSYITYRFLQEQLEARLGREVCRNELWHVSPTWTGWQAELAQLATVQPVGTPELRAAAIERFSSLPEYLQTEIANLREGLELGYVAPRSGVRSVVSQLDALLATPDEEWPYYSPAARDSAPGFADAMRRVIAEEVRPAIRGYRDFLAEEYDPRARASVAVSDVLGGEACYDASVRYWTSVGFPARDIHRTGLEQMEAIQAGMREIAERRFATADVNRVLERLKSEPEFTFDSREHMIAYASSAVERARAAVPRAFGIVPRAPVVIEPYPPFQEKAAPGGQYLSAPDDGSRPAVYMINTYQPERQSIAGLESTAFHETYPGHHLQIAIAKERAEAHPITRYFGPSGFSEGWALYSERLSDELGLFSGDIDRLGLLSNEALRAARLVVDAGMHRLGWTRRQAIDYVLAHTAESEARATAEVDRYIAVPGQATSYMLGNLEILSLRARAREALGASFDLRAFHDRVLEDGALTLPLLRDKIERWIEEERGG